MPATPHSDSRWEALEDSTRIPDQWFASVVPRFSTEVPQGNASKLPRAPLNIQQFSK